MYKRLLTIILCVAICFSALNIVGCKKDNSFTVTFTSGYDNSEPYYGDAVQVVTHASQIVEPIYVREGYNFVGWNISLSRISGDTKVVAQWKKYEMHVVFYGNGGRDDNGNTVINLTVDSAKELIDKQPLFKNKGYDLSWEPKLATINGSCEVNAVWTLKEYNVTYKDKFGQDFNDNIQTIKYNQTLDFSSIVAPHSEGEKFVCWQDENGLPIDNGIIWDVDDDLTLKANYAPKNDYVITYDLNGGNRFSDNVQRTFNENSVIDIANPTRKGYGFDGWQINGGSQKYLGEEISLEQLKNNGNLTDVTLKACWSNVPYVAVFDADGGQFAGQGQVEFFFGSQILNLPIPQKQDYEFVGWFYEDMQIKEGDVWDLAEDVTITAKYKAKYKIKFSLTGCYIANGQQFLCKLLKWGEVPKASSLEEVELEIMEGQSLLSLGIAIMPVVDPIEEYMVNEYVFGNYWEFIDSENVGHKVLVNTIFNSENLPNIVGGDTIVLVPHINIAWSPNY